MPTIQVLDIGLTSSLSACRHVFLIYHFDKQKLNFHQCHLGDWHSRQSLFRMKTNVNYIEKAQMVLPWMRGSLWPHPFTTPCPFPSPPASDEAPSPGPTDVSEGLTVPNCLPGGYKNTSRQSVVTNTPAKQTSPTQQLQCSPPTHLALLPAFSVSVTHHNDSRVSWQTASCSPSRLVLSTDGPLGCLGLFWFVIFSLFYLPLLCK